MAGEIVAVFGGLMKQKTRESGFFAQDLIG